jgi:hypothetical protein
MAKQTIHGIRNGERLTLYHPDSKRAMTALDDRLSSAANIGATCRILKRLGYKLNIMTPEQGVSRALKVAAKRGILG